MRRVKLQPVAAVVAVVLVVAGLLLALSAQRYGSRAAASVGSSSDNQVLVVAQQDAVDFTTYDYRDLRTDFDRFLAQTTSPLHAQYAASVPDLIAQFRDRQVQSVGQVVSAGIGQRSANQVTVLVAVNDMIRNKAVPNGRTVYDRLAFVLKRVGNKWLASEVHEL